MASSTQAKSALPYIQRLLEDEYVQDQLRNAASGLREAYQRTSKQKADAAEDKRLYRNLREAATSLRNASTALQRQQPKPKRRMAKLVTLAAVGGGAVLLATKLQKDQSQGG